MCIFSIVCVGELQFPTTGKQIPGQRYWRKLKLQIGSDKIHFLSCFLLLFFYLNVYSFKEAFRYSHVFFTPVMLHLYPSVLFPMRRQLIFPRFWHRPRFASFSPSATFFPCKLYIQVTSFSKHAAINNIAFPNLETRRCQWTRENKLE